MTTIIRLAQSRDEAIAIVSEFRTNPYIPYVGLIGPDTRLEVGGNSDQAQWIVIGSTKKIYLDPGPKNHWSDAAKGVFNTT